MDVKRGILKDYPSTKKNFERLKTYLKELKDGRTKINRQDSTRRTIS